MRIIQSATFKLTLWYLGIIMVLSVLFSGALYRISDDQMSANATRQMDAVARLPLPLEYQAQRLAYVQDIYDQLERGRHNLLLRLLLLNAITLLIGGGASYLLARRTLGPVQDAMEQQGRFTADASHELRTPLTAIRTEVEVALRDKQLSLEDARKLLSSNLEEVSKLEALSSALLRLARFENAIDPNIVERVSTRDIIEAAVDRNQTQIARNDIEVDAESDESTVEGDKTSLVELISILIDNAIKYSDPGSTIKLRSRGAGHQVTLSVADQGVGIRPADIPHIFNRFYRADRSRSKQKVDGYGLGLSIAARIADIHRGEIIVQSTVGEGSVFTVKLPARRESKRALF